MTHRQDTFHSAIHFNFQVNYCEFTIIKHNNNKQKQCCKIAHVHTLKKETVNNLNN